MNSKEKELYDLYEEIMYDHALALALGGLINPSGLINPKPKPERNVNICDECSGDMQQTSYGFLACSTCGLCDLDSASYVNESYTNNDIVLKNKTLYRRRQYCINKLQLLAGMRHCRSTNYKKVIEILKDIDFDDLTTLKSIMKEKKLSTFYKYIYVIWNDIKHQKLINLSDFQIQNIASKFIEIETRFKESCDNRKNIYCYNSVIYVIMKDMNIPGYEHILLPNNHDQIVDVIKKINT